MKNPCLLQKNSTRLILAFLLCLGPSLIHAQAFSVTASGLTAYIIDGNNNPTLTLQRGVTYVFNLNGTAIHPFYFKSSLGFGTTGTLSIITPATPPTVRIVFIDIAQFITIRATGTNGWSTIPEFKCDLTTPTWSPIVHFTNVFNAGTNTTTFPRLDPIC